MSSKGSKGSSYAGSGINSTSKGEGIEHSDSGNNNVDIDLTSHDMEGVQIDPSEEGAWKVYTRKSRSRGGAGVFKPRGPSNTVPRCRGHQDFVNTVIATDGASTKAPGNNWAQPADPRKHAGRGNPNLQSSFRSWESAYMVQVPQPAVIPPPLQNGWQWGERSTSSSLPKFSENEKNKNIDTSALSPPKGSVGDDFEVETVSQQPDDDSDGNGSIEDSDDDLSDEYDSDASQKSHGTRKKSNWFKAFFEELDKLTVDQLNEQTRDWHCPACKDGPGATGWYTGLQPLMTHAKTKGSKRVKLHRELAKLLEEELQQRGTSVVLAGEVFGEWKGLQETTDHEIVWPPMVVVMNTRLEQDENEKWIGMGNQELVDYFSTYAAVRARHSYGPQGHRGMSVLIFEPSAVGYLEAERLHKHFINQGTDREAWLRRRVCYIVGGKRQLYGYLANKEDMNDFNQHSQGKSGLKFEERSYQETVVSQMRQMNQDNQQLAWLKNKYAKQELHKKTLEESFEVVSQKLRETMEENKIVRERTTAQHKQNQEEMDCQERFFKEQIEKIQKATLEKETHFERLLQEERAKAKHSGVFTATKADCRRREEEIAQFISSQTKEVEEFVEAREELIQAHEAKKVELRHRHLEEEVELEKDFDAKLTKLMEKYSPVNLEASTS